MSAICTSVKIGGGGGLSYLTGVSPLKTLGLQYSFELITFEEKWNQNGRLKETKCETL